MQHVTETVKKSVQDAAYIAVGVGVLGAQQAQSRAGDAKGKLESTAKDVAKDASTAAGTGASAARERLEAFAKVLDGKIRNLKPISVPTIWKTKRLVRQ
jgi:hypothetical protein